MATKKRETIVKNSIWLLETLNKKILMTNKKRIVNISKIDLGIFYISRIG